MRNFLRTLAVVGLISGSALPAQAATIDLVGGDTGTANGAIYNWVDQQSTGTGVIDPFLRVQNNGTEDGYNTSAGTPFDTKAGIFTHELLKSDLVTKTIGGFTYYEFLLDINQNAGQTNELLSLNEVQIYTRSTIITSPTENLATLGTLQFDMDSGADGDTTVELDYTRNPGSGAGDMLMYVRTSLFDDAAASDYVYFYTAFGVPNSTNDGIEEWAIIGESVPVPDGGTTLGLLGLGSLAVGLLRRRLS